MDERIDAFTYGVISSGILLAGISLLVGNTKSAGATLLCAGIGLLIRAYAHGKKYIKGDKT